MWTGALLSLVTLMVAMGAASIIAAWSRPFGSSGRSMSGAVQALRLPALACRTREMITERG